MEQHIHVSMVYNDKTGVPSEPQLKWLKTTDSLSLHKHLWAIKPGYLY